MLKLVAIDTDAPDDKSDNRHVNQLENVQDMDMDRAMPVAMLITFVESCIKEYRRRRKKELP